VTDVEIRPSDPALAEDLVHVVCCDDFETSFCGIDVRGQEMTSHVPTTCVVCAELERAWHCPRRGRCKLAP